MRQRRSNKNESVQYDKVRFSLEQESHVRRVVKLMKSSTDFESVTHEHSLESGRKLAWASFH